MGNRKNSGIEAGSILVFTLGIFVLMSILSYQATDPMLFSAASGAAKNVCGRVGASVASWVLECFGIGSFLLSAALVFIAVNLHIKESWVKLLGILGGMAVAVSAFTVFAALQWKHWSFGGGLILTGGAFGTWISDFLFQHLNFLGSSLVSLLVFVLALVVTTPLAIAAWSGRVMKAVVLISSRVTAKLVQFFARSLLWLGGTGLMYLIRKTPLALGKVRSVFLPVFSPAPAAPVMGLAAVEEEEEIPEAEIVSESKEPSPPDLFGEASFETESYPEMTLVSESSDLPPPNETIAILPRETDIPAKTPPKFNRASLKARRGNWQLPTIEFLKNPPNVQSSVDRDRLIANSQILKQKFADFGIDGEVTAVRPGPVITLYEFKPGPGVKVSRIAALADDLSMALSAQSVRILAPLPGKAVVGIEIPSEVRETVYLREFLQHPDFYGPKHAIPVVMGKEIGGQTYLSDLARMPHLLCAGQTGSGKSVFMNGLICSLFYRFTPEELRMILVDPKFIEFRAYQDIPHLLLPVVDDPRHASTALKWAVREMERRYRILAKMGARNLASFNQKVEEMGAEVVRDLLFAEDNQSESASSQSGMDWIEAFEPDESGAPRVAKLPNIVIVIDELADLMMIAKKEVEISIARIAQKARAAGIHLIIATQRPSTDVVTGLIKANLPSRVSFQLASYVDSKTILDRAGAERLLGQGDMLFIPPGVSQTIRLHGAFLEDEEIHKITAFLRSQGKPVYRDEILLADDDEEANEGAEDGEDADALFEEAVELVKRSGHASASFLQRHFKVGYNRAARMIETMESRGIVGPQDGARPREVLMR